VKVAIIGSGPAGAAAAKALCEQGHEVDLLDMGLDLEEENKELAQELKREGLSPERLKKLRPPRANQGLKQGLSNLLGGLGRPKQGLDLMGKKRLGSHYIFKDVEWAIPTRGANVARSLAKGGLSNVWGAACYPLAKEDYNFWPLKSHEMIPHYKQVASLLKLMEEKDDLANEYDLYCSQPGPLKLNPASEALLTHWKKNKEALKKQGLTFGKARLAVDANKCTYCGLCHYGCYEEAIYRGSHTVDELIKEGKLTYKKGNLVQSYTEHEKGVTVHVLKEGKTPESYDYEALFLACGTLSSLSIVLKSKKIFDKKVPLLDNDLYLVPLWKWKKVASPQEAKFTLNETAWRIFVKGTPLHTQLYCMNEQIIDQYRPVINWMPSFIQKMITSFLGHFYLAFIYLPGQTSAHINVELKDTGPISTLKVEQQENALSKKIIRSFLKHLFKVRKLTGLLPIPFVVKAGPKGPSGGHVSGGLALSQNPGVVGCNLQGQVSGQRRVFAVDGSSLPHLPAQNSTYTIMANAHRIASSMEQSIAQTESFEDEKSVFERLGSEYVAEGTLTLEHHQIQYETSPYTAMYHHHVLKTCVKMMNLKPGMTVLDYGCSGQQLKKHLPPGVKYVGYDVRPEWSDIDESELLDHYDVIFIIQVFFYFDRQGLMDWLEKFAHRSQNFLVMNPSRNFLKDDVMDKILGLSEDREDLARSTPKEVDEAMSTRFKLQKRKNIFYMGEVSTWRNEKL
jgi:choline dehydrogenase-like flavoprotein